MVGAEGSTELWQPSFQYSCNNNRGFCTSGTDGYLLLALPFSLRDKAIISYFFGFLLLTTVENKDCFVCCSCGCSLKPANRFDIFSNLRKKYNPDNNR